MHEAFYGKHNGIFCACETVCTRPLLGERGLGTRIEFYMSKNKLSTAAVCVVVLSRGAPTTAGTLMLTM